MLSNASSRVGDSQVRVGCASSRSLFSAQWVCRSGGPARGPRSSSAWTLHIHRSEKRREKGSNQQCPTVFALSESAEHPAGSVRGGAPLPLPLPTPLPQPLDRDSSRRRICESSDRRRDRDASRCKGRPGLLFLGPPSFALLLLFVFFFVVLVVMESGERCPCTGRTAGEP
jgi:hypothetical protein